MAHPEGGGKRTLQVPPPPRQRGSLGEQNVISFLAKVERIGDQ